jgi:hypothetical protein
MVNIIADFFIVNNWYSGDAIKHILVWTLTAMKSTSPKMDYPPLRDNANDALEINIVLETHLSIKFYYMLNKKET